MEELIRNFSLILANPDNINAYRNLVNYYSTHNLSREHKAFLNLIETRSNKNESNNSNFDQK